MNIKSIKTENYNYLLSENQIAKYPLPNRDNSKLLLYNKGQISDKKFYDLPEMFTDSDLLIFNNTKVIQARLIFHKITGAKIEIFCLEPISPPDYALIFQQKKQCEWKCIIGNLKKWKEGSVFANINVNNKSIQIEAVKATNNSGTNHIEFKWNDPEVSFGEIIEIMGQTPIPPYLKRKSKESDKLDYQTVYSRFKGSVAAPTAGLHFTNMTFENFKKRSVKYDYITLHVGAGTFKPVKSENIGGHEMHTEHFSMNLNLLKDLMKNVGSVTAVGTTTVRTLESLYWLGLKLAKGLDINNFHINQWECYSLTDDISLKDSLEALYKYLKSRQKEIINASTQIIIVPGYKFKIINKLITNFHQPKSTLLLLIAAFIGKDWKAVYQYAAENNFRFLSYGDSSLLIP